MIGKNYNRQFISKMIQQSYYVYVKNGVIEELRHQNATQKFLQGNIYLARIEKIEPALQAAFCKLWTW